MKCARNGCLDDAVEHISQYRADDGKPTCDLYCRDLHNADLELAEVTARLAAAEKAKHNIATELGRAIGERALALAVVEPLKRMYALTDQITSGVPHADADLDRLLTEQQQARVDVDAALTAHDAARGEIT